MSRLEAPLQVLPHLFIVYSEYPHVDSGNVFLITGDRPTLIDCGSQRAVPQIVSNMAQLGIGVTDLRQILATHGDFDHVQGFHRLRQLNPDLRISIHPGDLPIVQGDDIYGNASYLYGQPFVPIGPECCRLVEHGDVILAGDDELTVVHATGHTAGSVCYLGQIGDQSVLFAGDVIGGAMRSLSGATLDVWAQAVITWEQSLHRLSALPFDWVLNGHEPAATLPLPRASFDRLLPYFGKMLNPWFHLGEAEPTA